MEEVLPVPPRTESTLKGSGMDDDDILGSGATPPSFTSSASQRTSNIRRSESASSSGSTDIFDDIFDTWTGDPSFGQFGGRIKSLLKNRPFMRSPFTRGRRSPGAKSRIPRTESAERRADSQENDQFSSQFTATPGPRRPSRKPQDEKRSEEETSDQEQDEFGGAFGTSGGLWKFLNTDSPASRLLDKHRSMFSKHFDDDDFFGKRMNARDPNFKQQFTRFVFGICVYFLK